MAAVSNYGRAMDFTLESQREDLEVVLAALQSSPYAIPNAEKLFPYRYKIISLLAKSGLVHWYEYEK